ARARGGGARAAQPALRDRDPAARARGAIEGRGGRRAGRERGHLRRGFAPGARLAQEDAGRQARRAQGGSVMKGERKLRLVPPPKAEDEAAPSEEERAAAEALAGAIERGDDP